MNTIETLYSSKQTHLLTDFHGLHHEVRVWLLVDAISVFSLNRKTQTK